MTAFLLNLTREKAIDAYDFCQISRLSCKLALTWLNRFISIESQSDTKRVNDPQEDVLWRNLFVLVIWK